MVGAAQLPQLSDRIDWVDAFKRYLEQSGYENVDSLFTEPSEIDQVADFVKQLPQEYQQAIMQNITPMLQQAQMAMQAQGQQQEQGVM